MNPDVSVNVLVDAEPNISVQTDDDTSVPVNTEQTVNVSVESDADISLTAELDDSELLDVPVDEGVGEIAADHRRLLHRDAVNQHPMSAIEGLTDAIATINEAIRVGFISAGDAINAVQIETAGKNTVYHASTQPTGGDYKIGDTWFNSSESYCMYTWNGSQWVREQFGNAAFANACITNALIANGTLENAKIKDGTLENAKIKDGTIEGAKIKDATIQSAKIESLDVAKLTGGYIDAGHINTASITIGESQVTGLATDLSNISAAASNAEKTATNYISISGSGIDIHAYGDNDNKVNLNSAGMSIYAGGTEMAQYGSTARIGSLSGYNINVDTTEIQFRSGTTVYGYIDTDSDGMIISGGGSSSKHLGLDGSTVYIDASSTASGALSLSAMDGGIDLTSAATPIRLAKNVNAFLSIDDKNTSLGTSSHRWKQVYAVDTSINTSDRKNKDVAGEIDFAEDLIMSLRPIDYYWKDGDHRRKRMGFVAQEVSDSCKEMGLNLSLYTASYIVGDEDGEVPEVPYYGEDVDDSLLNWGLSSEQLIAPIVKVIQNQQQRIEALEQWLS